MEPVNEKWVLELLATPMLPDWRKVRAWRRGTIRVGSHELYVVLKTQRVRHFSWRIYLWYVATRPFPEVENIVASGTAIDREQGTHVLEIGASAVRASWRRSGVYTATLKELRRLFGGPIESDTVRAAGADRAWRKAGGVDVKRGEKGVVRINPAPGTSWTEVIETADVAESKYVYGYRTRVWHLMWVEASSDVPTGTRARSWSLACDMAEIRSNEQHTLIMQFAESEAKMINRRWCSWGFMSKNTISLYADDIKTLRDEDMRKIGTDGYSILQKMMVRLHEIEVELNNKLGVAHVSLAGRR